MGRTTFFDLPEHVRDKIYHYLVIENILDKKIQHGVGVYTRRDSDKYSPHWTTWAEMKDFIRARQRYLLNDKQCRLLLQVLPRRELAEVKHWLKPEIDIVYTESFATRDVVGVMLDVNIGSVIFDFSKYAVSAEWSVWRFAEMVVKEASSRGRLIDDVIVLLPWVEQENGCENSLVRHFELSLITLAIH